MLANWNIWSTCRPVWCGGQSGQGGADGAERSSELQALNSSQLLVLCLRVGVGDTLQSYGWARAHPDGAASGGPGHPFPTPAGAQRLVLGLHRGPWGRGWGGSRVGPTSSAVILSAWDINSRLMLRTRREKPKEAVLKKGIGSRRTGGLAPGESCDLTLPWWDAPGAVRSPFNPTHSHCRCVWEAGSRVSPRHQGVVDGESFLTHTLGSRPLAVVHLLGVD